jgi:hypothetical protein
MSNQLHKYNLKPRAEYECCSSPHKILITVFRITELYESMGRLVPVVSTASLELVLSVREEAHRVLV